MEAIMSEIKKIVITALSVALCVVLPMAFHAVPKAGILYLPMHLPVLLGGLIVGPLYGIVIGLLGPLLSSLLTGMPPSAMLPTMMIELALYGLFTGLFIKVIKTKWEAVNLYSALVLAMLVGRIGAGIAKALFFTSGQSYSIAAWATGYFVTGIAGIIIQLIAVPALYYALSKAKLITK